MSLMPIQKDLQKLANPKQAKNLQRFFKTGIGEYGEGDIFLGLKVPPQRKIAKKYQSLSLKDLQILLNSKIHEERLTSLFVLISQFKKANKENQTIIFNFYLKNIKNINNWDLVDLSSPKILGGYLLNKKSRRILYKLARSKNLWEKRISILATFAFIKNNDFNETLKIAKILLKDKHELIHKAVGWMLREIGKQNKEILLDFLDKYYNIMPRVMLRYSIEKLPKNKKQYYLKLKNK